MKKLFVIFSMLAIVAAAMAVSCKKEAKDSIKLDKQFVNVSDRAEVITMNVTASGEYSGQPDAEWLSVSGPTITVSPNYYEAARTANVTFYCGSEKATVVINQAGRGPKEVVAVVIDALLVGDFPTFWECVDMTDAQKDYFLEQYNTKTDSETTEETDFKGYKVISETIDNTTGTAVVKVKYEYKEHEDSEQDWPLIKRDGKWKLDMKIDELFSGK
ncbi:MAG: DUF4878 domain-containing protein [Bacteroidales bacterium]|nr:DUF4878 domain-containing protein [Bacteroidales bacterium]